MKYLRSRDHEIDAIDAQILQALSKDARMPMTALAQRVHLSPPSVTERVRRLEELDIIHGYHVQVNPAGLGMSLSAYVQIRPLPGQLQRVAALLNDITAVVECDRVTGDDCFIARVHVRSVEELEAVIDQILPYATTNTSIVQSSIVGRRLPPIALLEQ